MLRGALEWLGTGKRHVHAARSAHTIVGGTVASACETALTITQVDLDAARRRVEQLADLCDRRAVVCAQHARDLAEWSSRSERWEQAVRRYHTGLDDPTATSPWPGPAPARPTPPAPWVGAG